MTNGNGSNSWKYLWREALVALSLGWDLALPIFAGVLGGYFLDRWLNTGSIFTLGLMILGVGIGYYNVARFIRRVDKYSRQNDEQSEEHQKQK